MEKNAFSGEGKDLMGALWNLIMVNKFSNYSCKSFLFSELIFYIWKEYFAKMQFVEPNYILFPVENKYRVEFNT